MNNSTSNPSCSSPHHRLAGLPLMYSPQTKTPLYYRLQASFWRAIFAAWTRLHLKHSRTFPNQPGMLIR